MQAANVRAVDSRLRTHGLVGRDRAYLWVFDPRANFENLVVRKEIPEEWKDGQIDLWGLARGRYGVQWWNTRTGKVISEQSITVSEQPLRLVIPPFTRDVAVKILSASR